MLISAVELAGLQLPKLPNSRQGIEYHAKKNNWPFEEVVGQARGGKLKKYLVSALPSEIQAAIQEKQAATLLAKVPMLPAEVKKPLRQNKKMRQLGLIPCEEGLARLDDRQTETAHARCAIVAYVLPLHELAGMPIKKAVAFVAAEATAGRLPEDVAKLIPLANARNNGERSLSEPTLYRWVRAYRAAPDSMSRLLALAPVKTREKTPLLAIDWLPYFLMFYQRPNKPTMMAAAKKLAQWYLEQGKIEQMPSYDQIQTVMKRLPEHMKERGRRTGSAYKALLPYIDRDWTALKPNDVWVGDGHSFKAKIRHPMGYLFTPEVTMIVDGCSGAVVGWSVALSETAVAVADALRHGMTHFPPPLGYYSDNGSGETGDMLDKETTGILPRIGIEHFTGIPGNPQGRGKIERLWQTITIPLAKQYATYQGKDADAETLRKVSNALASAQKVQKKGKELNKAQEAALAAAPTWAQFMADLEEAVRRYNFEHEHRSLPKNPETGRHFTPMKYYEYRMKTDGMRVKTDVLSPLELDFMYRPEEERIPDRGAVSLHNNTYFHQGLLDYSGQKVRVAYDIHDADHVIVKDMLGKVICKAVFNGNKRAAFTETRMEQLAERRRKGQAKRLQDKMDLIEAQRQSATPIIEQQPDFGEFLKLETESGGLVEVENRPSESGKGKKKLRDFLWEDAG